MSEHYASMVVFQDARNRIGVILKQLANIAEQRGDEIIDNQSVSAKVTGERRDFRRPLAEMLNERAQNVLGKTAFRVAVIGEFNTGKSTLINALLGREILSTSIKPKTAAKTILRHGEVDSYRVTYNVKYAGSNSPEIVQTTNLADDIAKVTSDDADALLKGKEETIVHQIKEVEIWCNSEFLDKEETEIIDTPGLGSVIEEHKLVTYSLIPEMDATLYLFPSDPGLGDDDRAVLDFIRQHINQLLFVMTKTDRLSKSEQAEMLSFSRDVIQEIAKIPVDQVYGVSARAQIAGQTGDSGFKAFLHGLEAFLISSRGVVRLQVPFAVAQIQCENLIKNTQSDLRRIDDDVETLRAELQRLKDTQNEIEEARKKLIKKVEDRMNDIADNALAGIQTLPLLVEKRVETALDEFNKESLKKADVKLQAIINDTVNEWVKDKDKSFMTQVASVQDVVDSELRRFVRLLDETTSLHLQSKQSSDINAPDISALGSGRGTRLIFNTAVKAGGAFITGLGATAAALMVPSLVPVILPVLISFPFLLLLTPLVPIVGDMVVGEKRIRQDIKKQLKQSIPSNSVNTYEAVVEGYEGDGEHHPGLRETLQTHFHEQSENLKFGINDFVSNLVTSQLDQVQKQIEEKENNTFHREQRLEMHRSHLTGLEKINKQLTDLELDIRNMSGSSDE